MTTIDAARAALEKMTGGKSAGARALITKSSAPIYPDLHIRLWGQPKMGKSHLGLDARTHTVYGPPTMDGFKQVGDGELLIESQPLVVAYANFDRDAATVIQNLHDDVLIMSEAFYLDDEGNPFIAPTTAMRNAQLERFKRFLTEATDAGVDLFQLDGGTIAWEGIRGLLLGAPAGQTPEGEARHLPRQYEAPNNEMRGTVMQRLYGMPMHTVLTTEAGQVWNGQNSAEPDATEEGGVKLRPDSWNKTDHYVDASLQMRYADRNIGGTMTRQHEARYTACIRPPKVGSYIANPTFAGIFRDIYPAVPLLKREDRALFEELKTKFPTLVWK